MLERNQHTVPWWSRAGEMAPRGLGEGVPGVRGVRLRGGPSGGCGGPGLGLGPGGDAVHQPGICPPVPASGLKPPKSSITDQVGVQTQAFPTQ